MAMPGYAKDIQEVLRECVAAFDAIQRCVADDGTICAPNQEDLLLIALAKDSIFSYRELQGLGQ